MRALGGALVIAIFSLSVHIHRHLIFPYPPFNELIWDLGQDFSGQTSLDRPLGSEGGFRDLGGLLFGMRRLTADIAWISVLQYYGAHEASHGEPENFGGGQYPLLKKMVLRAARLDPNFHFAYLYGAGSLALNLDRYDEAIELLEEGIRRNPTFWRLRLYLAGIIWKKKGEYDKLIPLLEQAISYPDCPTLVKSCLANIYKARKNYARALEIWLGVMEQENLDMTFRHQAEEQISDLRSKLGL